MKDVRKSGVAGSDGALLAILSEINSCLITIQKILDSNPLVAKTIRNCDVRQHRDFVTEEQVYCFETYVDVTTHAGMAFNWSLDIILTSRRWKFQRSVGEQTSDGEQAKIDFEQVIFEKFDDLAEKYFPLMTEFVESAKNFEFGSRLESR